MEWKKVKLGEIAEFKTGKLNSNAAVEGGKYPFFTCAPTPLSINEYAFDQQAILLAGNNAEGNFALNYYNGKFNAYQRTYVITPLNNTDIKYLYYSLSICLKNFKVLSQGTSTRFLTMGILSSFDLSLPPLPTQRRIAAILSSLDAQIENNNRINRNLEAQAQALFKSWFVDFEPWGGVMPEDWREGKLGEICTFKRGKNLLSKDAINEGVPVVAGGMEPACYHNMANTGAPVITISGSGANAGFMRMYHVPVWASDCSFIDVSCPNMYFVYCFLSCNEKLLRHAQTGAVQPHVKPSDIHDFDIIIPLAETIHEFQSKVQPLFLQVGNNTEANARLASLRDTLLPKLMKGEIEV